MSQLTTPTPKPLVAAPAAAHEGAPNAHAAAPGRSPWHMALLGVLWVALAVLPALLVNLGRNLNPDEHQFVVAGVLLLREGLLPYRDYAYFHVPNLALVYAGLFALFDSLLLSARAFSLAGGALLLATMVIFVRRRARQTQMAAPAWAAAAAALLFGLSPLFVYTTGRAWNHDLPVLLGIWATLAIVYGMQRRLAWGWLLLAGLMAGFAAGTRSSFVFLLLPMAAAVAAGDRAGNPGAPAMQRAPWVQGGFKGALLRLVAFGAGATIGLLPVAYMAAQAPAAFLFGNIEYARMNTAYRVAEGVVSGMSFGGKLGRLGEQLLLPGNLLIVAAWLAFGLPRRAAWRNWSTELRPLILILLPFVLAGSFAPTPAWPQYFYVLMPFIWLAALDGFTAQPPAWWGGRTSTRALVAILLALLVLWGITNRRDLWDTVRLRFFPVIYHNAGMEIAGLLGPQSDVLTLAPTLPLEGKLQIYPELATGPFSLRAATMATREQQVDNNLPPVGALEGWLADRPPRASLLRVDRNDYADEKALADYVAEPGFVPLPLRDRSTLYVNPLATWDDNIRLAAVTVAPDAPMPGETLELLNYLQALEPTAHNLSRIVRLRSADGTPAGSVAAQVSGWPWGQPTSTWQPGDVWYDGVQLELPADAAPGLYRLELELYDADGEALLPLALGTGRYGTATTWGDYLVVGEWPGAPATPLRRATRIGDFARLNGYTLDDSGSDALGLRLFWRGERPAAADYTVFVQLLDGSGTPVAQHDKPPLDGFYPTRAWKPELAFADDFVLPLPSPLPPGPYTLLVGMYDPATGALPASHRSRSPHRRRRKHSHSVAVTAVHRFHRNKQTTTDEAS